MLPLLSGKQFWFIFTETNAIMWTFLRQKKKIPFASKLQLHFVAQDLISQFIFTPKWKMSPN